MKWSELDKAARNALVAEKVVGIDLTCTGNFKYVLSDLNYYECLECGAKMAIHPLPVSHARNVPDYCGDMNAAMLIVQSQKFMSVTLNYSEGWHSETERWQVYDCIISPYEMPGPICAYGQNMPEAICLAALKACGVEIEP